ncbi:hypothetical protein E6O75_ATG05513 [Venturia nashicola]|uniref:Uncharacterized protein n=1 Tax=Venturia nashicola TaxID=86259 RepID=A0A4Z1P339_9PEZI|nr:hypothetical protein E6O75_ATG05513 [Venturia nashicola]
MVRKSVLYQKPCEDDKIPGVPLLAPRLSLFQRHASHWRRRSRDEAKDLTELSHVEEDFEKICHGHSCIKAPILLSQSVRPRVELLSLRRPVRTSAKAEEDLARTSATQRTSKTVKLFAECLSGPIRNTDMSFTAQMHTVLSLTGIQERSIFDLV